VIYLKINKKLLAICLAIPLAVGGLSALLTMGSMDDFAALEQPPLSPPGWLFPVVWTILFALMGISLYLVINSGVSQDKLTPALTVFAIGLAFNFFWSIWFFNFGWYVFAFVWLLALWVIIIINAVLFYRISKPAGLLFIPYILWVTFAAYLNAAIAVLN
jgi:tryptophan-rich sensory protein